MSVKKFKLNRKFSKRNLLGLGVLFGVFLAQFSFASTDDGIDPEILNRGPTSLDPAVDSNISIISETPVTPESSGEGPQSDVGTQQESLSGLPESAEAEYRGFHPDPLSQEVSPVVQPEVSQSPQGVIEAGVQMLPQGQDQLPSSSDPNQAQNVATF